MAEKSCIHRNSLIILLCLLIASGRIFSAVEDIAPLFPSGSDPYNFEIGQIRFVGNTAFDDNQLLAAISSGPSNISLTHFGLKVLYDQLKKNKHTPKQLDTYLKKQLLEFSIEIRFFSLLQVEGDLNSLKNYYNQNGFHNVSAAYSFLPDMAKRINVLTFHISENNRSVMAPIVYYGLDSLPREIKKEIDKFKIVDSIVPFSEKKILQEIGRVNSILQNGGYYYSKIVGKPIVTSDTLNRADSITVNIFTGKRQRIGQVILIDSLRGQSKVVEAMKEKQLEFAAGQWYSRAKVQKSIENLLSLGTFDRAIIDTTSHFVPITDSTLPMEVLLQYRELQDYGAGVFINQRMDEGFLNLGLEAEYIHRNIFGAAQVLNPFVNVAITDVNSFLSGDKFVFGEQLEVQLGIKFAQPLLWTIDDARVGFGFNPLYSFRKFNKIKFETFTMPFKFPIQLPKWTFFNTWIIDWSFDRQRPIDLQIDINNILRNSTATYQDSVWVMEAIEDYQRLDDYLKDPDATHWFTSNLLGISFIADKRDNIFSPSKGVYTNVNLNTSLAFFGDSPISGLANYSRGLFTHFDFYSISKQSVFAWKIKVGGIRFWDENNKYVSIERQFFAGGANSVRAWPSRKLRYTKFKPDTLVNENSFDILEDIVGSQYLIEGSIELRHRFSRPKRTRGIIAEQLEKLGVTAFMDFGNAFGWFAEDTTEVRISNFIEAIAVAIGFGIRYETPVGPFRIDFAWPMYDPLGQRKFAFNQGQIHFGIGHAF